MTPSLWTPDQGYPDGARARDYLRRQRERDRARRRHIRDPIVDAILDRQCAVAHVQTLVANDNDVDTTATGPSITTTAGNLLGCVIYGFDPGAGNPTCSVSSFNSVAGTQAITRQQAGGDSRIYIFYWENIAGVTAAPTFTVSANARWSIFAVEISGCATSSALDGAGSSDTATSTAPAPGVFSAGTTDGFTLSAFGAEIATGSITGLTSPWVTPTNGTTQNIDLEAGVQYQLASPASVNGTWTISSAAWVAAQVVFKAAAAGGGGVPNFIAPQYEFGRGRSFVVVPSGSTPPNR
jgi:hypothetical protein